MDLGKMLNERVINLPFMALRGITVFPGMIINFDVERPQSIDALNTAGDSDRIIFLSAQKDIFMEKPEEEDIYKIGTVCVVRQFIRGQNGGMRVMVEGKYRGKLLNLYHDDNCQMAEIEIIGEENPDRITPKTEALIRQAVSLYERHMNLNGNTVNEALISLSLKSDAGYVADYIIQNIRIKNEEKQHILETISKTRRLNAVCQILEKEIKILEIEHSINEKLKENLMKVQRDNILREQMRVIKSELGDDEYSEIDEYQEKIAALKLDEEIENKLLKELDRLSKQQFGSAEASVIRSYLDVCLELPWNEKTKDRLNVKQARKILDGDHYGLDKVKERIIEHLAVKQLTPTIKSPIICFVGPPGVGKTSIAISIAKAMNRKLARMSLGGVHDEAEIRGHRKTYVGAMPGRIINAVVQAKSMNPIILLDEIDKLGSDFRGDPASALLEALDPEQNNTFRDNFLEIPFDLSDVLFITTANTTDTIPRPLLDRMEVIELTSYTDEEKLHIAKEHLIPKQRKKHGLTAQQLRFTDNGIREIIAGYTRESGVRLLEREIGSICRKTAAKIASEEAKSLSVTPTGLEDMLGPRKFKQDELFKDDQIGIVKGLAWTAAGGEILEVEVNVLDGTGRLELTGNLGDVMKESAKAAVSYIRSRAQSLGIDKDFYKNKDIHIHFPEGAIPKDGPSAGITITVAVISALTKSPVRSNVAMTGEITLSGRVLPIGGLKEKTMAAMRNGVKTVIIPSGNESDLEEIDQDVRRALVFIAASHVDNILDTAIDFSRRPDCDKVSDLAAADIFTDKKDYSSGAVISQ